WALGRSQPRLLSGAAGDGPAAPRGRIPLTMGRPDRDLDGFEADRVQSADALPAAGRDGPTAGDRDQLRDGVAVQLRLARRTREVRRRSQGCTSTTPDLGLAAARTNRVGAQPSVRGREIRPLGVI